MEAKANTLGLEKRYQSDLLLDENMTHSGCISFLVENMSPLEYDMASGASKAEDHDLNSLSTSFNGPARGANRWNSNWFPRHVKQVVVPGLSYKENYIIREGDAEA